MNILNKSLKKSVLGVVLSALLACTFHMHAFATQTGNIILTASSIRFVSTQMGVAVEGGFRSFTGAVNVDLAKPEATRASIEVDLNSIDIGSEEAETEVKRKPWFNIAIFPKAQFVSTGVKALGGDRYEIRGKLSIKGISQDTVLAVTVKKMPNNTLVAEGSFPIKRLDFGIGEGAWSDTDTVADLVQVNFKIVAPTPPK